MQTLQIPSKLEPFVRQHARYKIAYGGRGSGKSQNIARILLQAGRHRKERILCTREIQKSIRESVHALLVDQINEMGFQDFYRVTRDEISGANGTQFIFAGLRTESMSKLKSLANVTKCWIEEAQVVTDKSWQILIPTIRLPMSEFYLSFNPELDTDPTYERFVIDPPPDSIVVKMNWRDNPWFPKVLNDERKLLKERDKSHGKHVYLNVWEGECMPAVEGAIYAHEVSRLFEENRVRPLDYDSSGRVHGVMDLGYGVMTMVLVQKFASTVQIIGYIELTHSTYHDMTLELQKLPYRWGKIFMPHDATHKDPKYGKSHFDVMNELGWETSQIPQIGIEGYVDRGREMFQNLYISDSDDCKRLIHCLRRWKRQIPSTTDHATLPMKDEFSHGAEAFCYTAVVADELVNDMALPTNPFKGYSGYAG